MGRQRERKGGALSRCCAHETLSRSPRADRAASRNSLRALTQRTQQTLAHLKKAAVLGHLPVWRELVYERWQQVCQRGLSLIGRHAGLFCDLLQGVVAEHLLNLFGRDRLVLASADPGRNHASQPVLA